MLTKLQNMKNYYYLCSILIFSILQINVNANPKANTQKLTEKIRFINKIQPILQKSFQSNAMNKSSKVLTLYCRQSWDATSKSFKDTLNKSTIKWDSKGNPLQFVSIDYQLKTRTVCTQFVKSPVALQNANITGQYPFNWIPLVTYVQQLVGYNWVNNEIDSINVDANNKIISMSNVYYDSTLKFLQSGQRISQVKNANGTGIGFRIDSMNTGVWGEQERHRFDTTYNTYHHINGMQVSYYSTATASWIPEMTETYTLDANNNPTMAYRYSNYYKIGWDSFTLMHWLYFDTRPLESLTDQLILYTQPNLLYTGGNLVKYFDQYTLDKSTDLLVYTNSQNTFYNADSTVHVNINTIFSSGTLDSLRDAYTYYPDKSMQSDTSQNWTGTNWQMTQTVSNVNAYDVDNYLTTQINKTIDLATGTTNNYKDSYVYSVGAGINTPTENNIVFNLYPNPAAEILYVKFNDEKLNQAKLKLISMNGQTLQELKVEGTNTCQFNLSGLKPGMYLIYFSDNNTYTTKSFIKL